MKKFLIISIVMSLNLLADFTRDDTTQIVTDNKTGLQWQDNNLTRKVWHKAIEYCESLTLGNHDDWRLPNFNELYSITDRTKKYPAISSVFKNIPLGNYLDCYWTSTTYEHTPSSDLPKAWCIYFQHGQESIQYKYNNYFVRCVRGGR